MSKRALLIGSSFSSAPILARLRAHGIAVEVCGKYEDDPCHDYADASHYIDYSNRQALLEVVLAGNFDYLVPSCNDTAYMSGAWVAAQTGHVGFDRFDIAEVLHTKHAFRTLTRALHLPSPRSFDPSSVPLDAPYPLVAKPVDSFSGRGMTKIYEPSKLADAIKAAASVSSNGTAVVEEFIDGSLHSHSAFIVDGKIIADWFVDEFCSVYPYQVDCSNYPSVLPDGVRSGMRQCMERIAAHLSICDGLLHTQFIRNGDRYWIIETMRRCPGDLYGQLIERSLNIDYTYRYVAGFVGERAAPADAAVAPKLIGRHTISVATPQAVCAFSTNFPGRLLTIVALKASGKRLEAAPFDKLAIVFNEFASFDEMICTTPAMASLVHLEPVLGTRGLR
jgi:hypothetical protein